MACTESPVFRTDYNHMSIEERKLYNAQLIDHDQYQLKDQRCIFNPPKESRTDFQGPCKYEVTLF